MFDLKQARAWVAGPEMGTHKACKYILAACDRIEALERKNAAMARVVEAARIHFAGRAKYNSDGYRKHDAIIDALAALAPATSPALCPKCGRMVNAPDCDCETATSKETP